jgi:2-polyprenyl-3-methyl-5-hydroxy-6-metoxy-1,4-benzoquinol methylase
MTLADRYQMKDFWNGTASRFGEKGDYTPVLHPSAKGLLNWYTDYLQRTALNDVVKQSSGKTVLEVGCGVGRWTTRLATAGAQVIGIDLSREMAKRAKARTAKQNLGIDYVVSSASELPFVSHSFVLLISVTVLQHITEDVTFKLAVSEIKRTVRVGGDIVLLEYIGGNKENSCAIFPTVTHNYKKVFEKNGELSLIEVRGVDLSVLLKPLNRITRKHGKYRDLLTKHVPSSRYLLAAAFFYFLASVACLFSLPFDLAFRNMFRRHCEHAIFTFKSRVR